MGMQAQCQVKRQLSAPDAVKYVRGVLADEGVRHRTALADRVCDHFGFVDAVGVRQRSSCLQALRELEHGGLFRLPPAQTQPGPSRPKRLLDAVPPAEAVPETAGAVAGLRLLLVETEQDMRVWNELMIREHPRGAGPLVGRQLRYLVCSEHGYLGGLGFGAAALQLEARDRWIGWDVPTRRRLLHTVVGLSRFLIRPEVHCRNLASRILGLGIGRLRVDFERRYGFEPLLVETFVDTTAFSGTCYQAANWERIGQTKGRGRQDRARALGETVKDIYVLAVQRDFRMRMGLPPGSGLGPLGLAEGADTEHWADQEFGGAPLGDKRLANRLVNCARSCAEKPGRAFTGAAEGDWPAVKGYYRLIDKPDDSAVTPENILLPHRQQTIRRIRDQQTVLCIQDGTGLDYTNLAKCEGLGVTGKNQTGATSRGLHLHSTFAVTTEGLPLGVLRAEFSAPEPKSEKQQNSDEPVPIEEKKTFSWIEGLRDCREIAREAPRTQLVSVMDREADFFELFAEHSQDPSVDLLVRGQYNRCTTGELKLFDSVRESPVCARHRIHIKRQSARPKRSKQKARKARAERIAEVSLRYKRVQLRPPSNLAGQPPVDLWIVHVYEEEPPAGAERIEWFLLTSIEVHDPKQALTCLRWYCLRWRIEDWHRVLKSGCGIEDLAHETAERLMRAVAIRLVVGWRIMLMTLLGRECPDMPAEILFSDIEIEVLKAYAQRQRLKSPTRLGQTVRLVARLGGYLDRKNDPPPGHQLMWEGYIQLHFMCLGFELREPL